MVQCCAEWSPCQRTNARILAWHNRRLSRFGSQRQSHAPSPRPQVRQPPRIACDPDDRARSGRVASTCLRRAAQDNPERVLLGNITEPADRHCQTHFFAALRRRSLERMRVLQSRGTLTRSTILRKCISSARYVGISTRQHPCPALPALCAGLRCTASRAASLRLILLRIATG